MKLLIQSVIILTLSFGALYLYLNYGNDIYEAIFEEPAEYTIYLENVGVEVTLADTPEERRQGLSGSERLGEFEGKLFLFDEESDYGIWMKDMNYALDIIWINNDLRIVHIEENVTPDTYPDVFRSTEPARYVLEVNAKFTDTYKVKVGNRVTLPQSLTPADIRSAQEAAYSD